MLLFIDFCELWWLAWLLPFLLGLGLGYLLWSRYKGLLADAEAKIAGLNSDISKYQDQLKACKNKTADLEGDVATMKGRVREMEAAVREAKAAKGNTKTPKANVAKADLGAAVAGFAAGASTSTPKIQSDQSTKSASTGAAGGKKDPYARLKSDNLQIIEGIGPKMESVLHENGVKSWSDLAGKSESELKDILGKYGDKYRIIDPTSWSAQAAKASSGDWEGMIALQKSLDGGRANTGNNSTDSKLEKVMVRLGLLKKYKQDDLKAVEGIGPKIEGLLHDAGIKTWRALADSSVDAIQGILNAAGDRYKLADPGTWPKQAELAADGKWDELREYQDFLQGGK